MLKLMKYEFRKQLFSKLVILGIMGLLEIYFIVGLVTKEIGRTGRGIGFLVAFTFGVMLYVSFESIITYSNDLKTKQSYMLFMVPQSIYKVVGAKMLASLIQILIVTFAIGALAIVDIVAAVGTYGSIQTIKELFEELLEEFLHINIDYSIFIIGIVSIIVSWAATITVAMLSITLSNTMFANSKFRGIASFIIFILITVLISKMGGLITDHLKGYTLYIVSMLISAVEATIAYIATSWMLQKKVCV